MRWKRDMLFTRHLRELQNSFKHFCRCHFGFSSEMCVFPSRQRLPLWLMPYLAAPSSGKKYDRKENTDGPSSGSKAGAVQSPTGGDCACLEQLRPGFSWGTVNASSVPVTVLCFAFRMQMVLIAHWCFGFLVNHIYPKSRTIFFLVPCSAREEVGKKPNWGEAWTGDPN